MFNTTSEAIAWIEQQIKFKPKADLMRMQSAYKMMKIDLNNIKKIHVAGTNGKGSVSMYLTNIIRLSGLNVGTYMSPYVDHFNERIKINAVEVSDNDLLHMINDIYHFNIQFEQNYHETLSFFELVTLMAFKFFSDKNLDIIIIEVGLGGLLDATNILNYDLSLITSIGYDHMKQLGNTLESIAYNKLGILKSGNHLIANITLSLHDYFKSYLKDKNISYELLIPKYQLLSLNPPKFIYNNEEYELSLYGEYQIHNAILVLNAIKYLYPNINYEIIKKGLYETILPGRITKKYHDTYVDGAHNISALLALEDTLLKLYSPDQIYILYSALADKDINSMMQELKKMSTHVILTSFSDKRFKSLAEFAKTYDFIYIEDALYAYQNIVDSKKKNDVILITGSLHFAGYMRKVLHL